MAILVLKILGLVAASFIGLCILRFLFHLPEITFALFLFSYVIEGGDMIPGPIDLTPILLFISFAGFFLHRAGRGILSCTRFIKRSKKSYSLCHSSYSSLHNSTGLFQNIQTN